MYFPLVFGESVIASVAVQRVGFLLSEVKHLVVHPSFRGAGLSKIMLAKAIVGAQTPFLYATIREGNEASLNLFRRYGFEGVDSAEVGSHNVIILMGNKK